MRNKTLMAFALTSMFTVYASAPVSLDQYQGLGQQISAQQARMSALGLDACEISVADAMSKLTNLTSDQTLVDLLSAREALINKISAQEVGIDAQLSNIVYAAASDRFKAKNQNSAQIGAVESKIDAYAQAIRIMRDRSKEDIQDVLSGIPLSAKAVIDSVQGATQQIEALETAKKEAELELTTLKDSDKPFFQEKIDTVFGKGVYTVENVFYRNGSEISGIAIYNREANELRLIMTGSNSRWDWIHNLFGWNGKSLAEYGILRTMNFHAGFLHHLHAVLETGADQIKHWFENYKKTTHKTPLKIHGTGHSLGGALAMMFTAAAKEFAMQTGIDCDAGVVTFGAPNILNSTSVEKFEDLMGGKGNIVRVEDSYDFVPKACFWKENPGVTVSMKVGLLHDAAGAVSFVPRNAHSINDYWHAAEDHFKAWQENVSSVRSALGVYTQAWNVLEDKKQECDALLMVLSANYGILEQVDHEDCEALLPEVGTTLAAKNAELERIAAELKTLKPTSTLEEKGALLTKVRSLKSQHASLTAERASLTALTSKLSDAKIAELARLDKELAAELSDELGEEDTASEASTEAAHIAKNFDMVREADFEVLKSAQVITSRRWYKPWTWLSA